jgi:hypothetical protein
VLAEHPGRISLKLVSDGSSCRLGCLVNRGRYGTLAGPAFCSVASQRLKQLAERSCCFAAAVAGRG